MDSTVDGNVLRVRGEIDIYTSEVLRPQIQRLIAGDAPELVVDLTEVRYIDSVGIGTLMEAWITLRKQSRRLRIYGATAHVRRVFTILGLGKLLDGTPTFGPPTSLPVGVNGETARG